jgi:hypothetical protein
VKYVSGWTNVTFTICAQFTNLVQRKSLKEKASKGKDEVVLCLIKHYAMKLYGEIIAACILIILAMHEGQSACFYSPNALCCRKSPNCLLGWERVGSRVRLHIGENRETACVGN